MSALEFEGQKEPSDSGAFPGGSCCVAREGLEAREPAEEATRTRLTRVWSHSTQQGGGQGREEEWGPHGSGGGETQIVRGHATLVSAWTKLFSWDSPLGLRGLVSVPLSGGPSPLSIPGQRTAGGRDSTWPGRHLMNSGFQKP